MKLNTLKKCRRISRQSQFARTKKPMLEALEFRYALTPFTVNSTVDPGDGVCDALECTLREAIDAANSQANMDPNTPDRIEFSIAGTGPFTIQPLTGLPAITDPVVIDGYSQPGASVNTNPPERGTNAVLMIEIDGSLIATAPEFEPNGIAITAQTGASTIRGLVINRFEGGNRFGTGNGIRIAGFGGNIIEGNFIGTDVTGTVPLGNDRGIELSFVGANNRIGGVAPAARNVISGNVQHAIIARETERNVFQGNLIGTDASGTMGVGNGHAVGITSPYNLFGGTDVGAGNVVSGNGSGIHIGTANNTVQGNLIGTDVSGTVEVGNMCCAGVTLNGVGAKNNLIGGLVTNARNVISGNKTGWGIAITNGANSNVVQGNLIGTDVTGTSAFGNLGGISVNNAFENVIGGTDPLARNLISGNHNGVVIERPDAWGNQVQGNFIGTDVSGALPLGNSANGVSLLRESSDNLIGGLAPGSGNVISANAGHGVHMGVFDTAAGAGNRVQGNFIGTDLSGSSHLGNGVGVNIGDANDTVIGGIVSGAGNVIAHSLGTGVTVTTGIGNTIRGNSIVSNNGMGIDLSPSGATPNDLDDLDVGANNLQNYASITLSEDGLTTRVVGALQSYSGTTFDLDFFANAAADPTGHGEGERYLGSQTVTTDASGIVSFDITLHGSSTAGEFISSTVTGPYGTSEFSGVQVIQFSNTPPIVDSGGPYSVTEGGILLLDASATTDAQQDPESLLYEWDLDLDGVFGETGAEATRGNEIGATPTFSAEGLDGPDEIELSLRVTDDGSLAVIDTAIVEITSVAPSVDIVEFVDPVYAVGSEVTVTTLIGDPGIPDTFTVEWVITNSGGTVVTATQTGVTNGLPTNQVDTVLSFDEPGVYRAAVTVTDDDGGAKTALMEAMIVIYDPSGGFVTGGGFIDSVAGAYAADPTLSGRASFGFVSKYKRGANTPTGQTQFQFKMADLNFHSGSYQWLVVAGPRAKFKGTGTINGQGAYGFMLTAIDGDQNGGGGIDKFRIKIWDEQTDETVYDNQLGDGEDAQLTTAISAGSIVVHKEK